MVVYQPHLYSRTAPLIGEFFAETDRPRVLVVSNKCDLCGLAPQQREDGGLDRVWLSARGGQGIDLLVARLCARAGYQPDESTFIARTRHLDALRRTQQHLAEAHEVGIGREDPVDVLERGDGREHHGRARLGE